MSDQEDDYMSAAILEQADDLEKPAWGARKRRRPNPPPAPAPKPRPPPQNQKEAAAHERAMRAAGLKRSLLPSDLSSSKAGTPAPDRKPLDDGLDQKRQSVEPSKSGIVGRTSPSLSDSPPIQFPQGTQSAAWRQMLAMGYEPGLPLGTSSSVHDSTPQPTEPLPLDERRLKGGSHAKAGIGAASTDDPEAEAALAKVSESEHQRVLDVAKEQQARDQQRAQQADYRTRQSLAASERHQSALLRRAHHAVLTLDEQIEPRWNVWAQDVEEWRQSEREKAMHLPTLRSDPLTSDQGVLADLRAPRSGSEEGGDNVLEDVGKEPRQKEMEHLSTLSLAETLEGTLNYLRSTHHFCLFCREQYASAEELEAKCPGPEEVQHDD